MSSSVLRKLRDESDLCLAAGAEAESALYAAAANEIEQLREALRLIVWRDLRYVDGYLDGSVISRADILKARELGGFMDVGSGGGHVLDRELVRRP